MKTLDRVYAIATASRLITITIGIISFLFAGSYDTSAEIQLSGDIKQSFIQRCLTAFLRWDSLYFLHIAEHGYVYEQEYAFFPVMPIAARLVTNTVLYPFQNILGGQQYALLLGGVIVANVSFVLAAGSLFKLTQSVFGGNQKIAFVSAVAFCVSPPSMFMSSFYTESLFAYMSFTGMYLAAQGHYLSASVIWGITSGIRSNAIIYFGFFFYDFVVMRIVQKQGIKRVCTGITAAIMYSIPVFSGFGAFQYYGYTQFCTNGNDRPWCHGRIPIMYTFVQHEYWQVSTFWNNGFLEYYEIKQIPNFLLAAPIIILSVSGLWSIFFSLGFYSKIHEKRHPYTAKKAAVYMYLWAALLVYTTTFMHIQVIIRFFTSLPPLYWFTAHLWTNGLESSIAKDRWVSKGLLSYFVLYGLVGTVLFSTFLPPA
ncbi:GPI mannosyltransferase 2 [Phycomyces nitens]|nr:GPI mannosyltransferase 2 [Phycomyces nitens]